MVIDRRWLFSREAWAATVVRIRPPWLLSYDKVRFADEVNLIMAIYNEANEYGNYVLSSAHIPWTP